MLSRVGVGASAAVYRAYDRVRDAIVALKVLHETTDAAFRTLREEFEALRGIEHPNLVRLLDIGAESGLVYVAMELVEGVDFVRYVRPEPGLLDEERLRKALIGCVVGLDELHGIGKVHRDIKPSNVRVGFDGRVVILDFGLITDAHAGLALAESDVVQAGTAAYMAPEQALGDPVSAATDFYALGTMLFQALTGELPFNGSAHEMRVAKVSTPAPDPRGRSRAVPEDLAALCVSLLSMRAADRPDARQLLMLLGEREGLREPGRRASLPPPGRIPFVGRAAELSRIEQLVLRKKTETIGLHVVANPGFGKTTLLREARLRLEARDDVLWLQGTATPGRSQPFEAVTSIVEQLAGFLMKTGVRADWLIDGAESMHELFPVLRRVSQIPHRLGAPSVPDRLERRWRALSALKHVLTRVAAERHVVIAIDDFHHADLDTSRLAERLFKGPSSPPLLLLLASEPSQQSLPLGERHVLVLPALSRSESEQLSQLLTRDDEDTLTLSHGVAEKSEGQPLHLVELLRLSRAMAPPARVLPDSLRDAVAARRESLPIGARQALDALAVADTPLTGEVLTQVFESVDIDLSRACAQLAREGFAVVDDATHTVLSIAHGRLAEIVRELMSKEERAAVERKLCDALSGGDLSLAPTLVRLSIARDRLELAADAAFRVSKAAREVLAMDRAASYHSLSAELTQQKEELVQYHAARSLAECLAEAGRSVEAAFAYQLAYQTSNAASALDLYRRSAELFVHSGHMEQAGFQCIRDALDTVSERLPETHRGALLSLFRQRAWLRLRGLSFRERSVQQVSVRDLTRVDVLWSVGATLGLVDHVLGADFQARGLLYALRAGEPSRVARALALEAAFSATTTRAPHGRARALLARAREIGSVRRDPYLESLLSLSHGIVEWSHHNHEACLRHAIEAEQGFREYATDVVWEVTTAQQLIVAALPWLGRFRELDERAQRYQQEALERGSQHVHASIELYGGYVRILALDDPKNARARVKEAVASFPRERFVMQHMGETMALSWIDQYERRPIDEKRVIVARQRAADSLALRTLVCQGVILDSEARLTIEKGQRTPGLAEACAKRLLSLSRAIQKLGVATGPALCELWTAHARYLLGQRDEVPGLLERAERAALEARLHGFADALSYHRARLIGGDEGKQLAEGVVRRFKAEGVRNPARLVNAFVPSFYDH